MFPFQQGGELPFQTSGEGDQEDINNLQDLNLLQQNNNNNNYASAGVGNMNLLIGRHNKSNSRGRGRGRKSSSSVNAHDDSEKKIIHRDIERQRRQEVSNLYASLREVLPAEYIKGKRAISDHIAQAVNYIKHLERNVKELGEKRDELKNSIGKGGSSSSSCSSESAVNIRQIAGGLDIEINVDGEDERFSLSTALTIAHEEGLCVESYSSTKVDRRFVHNLLCEGSSDRTCIDLNRLQQRLLNLVSN